MADYLGNTASYESGLEILDHARRNWTRNNKFWIEFRKPQYSKNPIPQLEFLIKDTIVARKDLFACVIDVNLYDVVSDPMEHFIQGRYIQSQGRIQASQISVKWRDYDNAYLYKRFSNLIYGMNDQYPEDCALTITLCLEGGWGNEEHYKFAEAYDCILVSLSGLTFDNASQNQFLEFTTTFKTPKIEFNPAYWGNNSEAQSLDVRDPVRAESSNVSQRNTASANKQGIAKARNNESENYKKFTKR